MEDDVLNPFRKMSMRTRKIAPNMEAALASNDNRTHVSVYHCLVDFKKIVLIFCFRQHLLDLMRWRMIIQGWKRWKLLMITMRSIYKRSKKAQNAKPAKQKHLRMLAKPQGSFWRFYMRSSGGGCTDCNLPTPFSTKKAIDKPQLRCESR